MSELYIFMGLDIKDTNSGATGTVSGYVTDEAVAITPGMLAEATDELLSVIAASPRFELIDRMVGSSEKSSGPSIGETFGIEPHRNHVRFYVAEINSVMRRAQRNFDDNKKRLPDSPVLDLYPVWRQWRTGSWYGIYAEVQHWLNTPEDIAKFELYSGLKLDDMPVYKGQGALVRQEPHTENGETVVYIEDEEIQLETPIKVIIEERYVYDFEAKELRVKMRNDKVVTDENGEPVLMTRKVFCKWYGEWEAEVAAAAASLNANNEADDAAE